MVQGCTSMAVIFLAALSTLLLSSLAGSDPDINAKNMISTQPAFKLWADRAPLAIGDTDLDKPAITVYAPSAPKRNGTAVVVCPGGGFDHYGIHEQAETAKWLNDLGITAFVLHYRLRPRYYFPAPMIDTQRAVRYVRAHAAEYGLDQNRIGIIGFSAGGYLAAGASTRFDHQSLSQITVLRNSSFISIAILGLLLMRISPLLFVACRSMLG